MSPSDISTVTASATPDARGTRPTNISLVAEMDRLRTQATETRASRPWAALLIALIVMQSIAIPGTKISSVLVLGTLFFATITWQRSDAINPLHLRLFLLSILTLSLSTFVSSATGGAPSLGSLVLLLTHYWWFVVQVPATSDLSRFAAVRAVLACCAALGVVQFVVQPVIGYHCFLDILPGPIAIEGFATSYELYPGETLKKANGYFFLEPSVYSQFMAIGILLEVLIFNRRGLVLILMLGGLLVSFSGTGIILLVLTGLVAATQDRRQFANLAKFGVIGISAVLAYALIDFEGLQKAFLARIVEFALPGSSAHARFVAPMLYLIGQWSDWNSALFGVGPGMVTSLVDDVFADFTLVPKLLAEYGLIGGTPLLALILARLGNRHIAGWYVTMMLVFYWFLGGNLLAPVIIFAVFILHASTPRPVGKNLPSRDTVAAE